MKSLRQVLQELKPDDWEDLEDGHGNFKPKYYLRMGFEESHINKYIKTMESDGSWKGSFWKDQGKALAVMSQLREIPKGKPVPADLEKRFSEVYIPKITGVYNLDFVMGIAHELNIKFESKMGRGFQARAVVRALKEWVDVKNASSPQRKEGVKN